MADGKIKISELEEALQLSDNAEFPYAQDNGGVPTTFKAPANQIARKVAEGSTFTNLETTAKTLVGAINELSHLGNPILLGTTAPTSSQGANGNLYIQYTEGTGGASDTVDSIYAKIDGAWCEIETGGGGASTVSQLTDVLLSATIPDGDVLVRDNNLTGGKLWKNKTITVELTQAEYDQLVADDEVLPDVDYYITDAPSMQGTSADLSYDGTTLSTYDKIEEVASNVSDCKVERQYYTGTTSGYGNLALGAEFDSNTKVIISATARNKTNTNTVYIADIYQNDVNRFGTTYGLHVRNITDNSAVANTVIEGYIWLVKFTAT